MTTRSTSVRAHSAGMSQPIGVAATILVVKMATLMGVRMIRCGVALAIWNAARSAQVQVISGGAHPVAGIERVGQWQRHRRWAVEREDSHR
jgi:hypothetical protein